MSIKLKYFQLLFFNGNTGSFALYPDIEKFLGASFKNALLKYHVQVKLSKEIERAVNEFYEQRKMIFENFAVKKTVKLKDGQTIETFDRLVQVQEWHDNPVVEVDGKKLDEPMALSGLYDIPNEKLPEINKQIAELVNSEIELNVNKISLRKLAEEDCSEFNFNILEPFIEEDTEQ
jgi:Glu-tRNA(Gln) amidotransferase subunit E-like FAD-binding protein